MELRDDQLVKPRRTFAHGAVQYELDVRHVDRFGADLKKIILSSVARTQKYLLQELPAFLVVTRKQYVSLLDFTSQMHESTERMFITPLNVMEVLVNEEDEHVDPDKRDTSPVFQPGDVLQNLN